MALPVNLQTVEKIVSHIVFTGTKIEGGLIPLTDRVNEEVVKYAIERFKGERKSIVAFLGMEGEYELVGRCRAYHLLPLLAKPDYSVRK
jgi:hypothetical protein